jgi:hypothetical protein
MARVFGFRRSDRSCQALAQGFSPGDRFEWEPALKGQPNPGVPLRRQRPGLPLLQSALICMAKPRAEALG